MSSAMCTPSKQFAGMPELLSCLGEMVINRGLLQALCLTSKGFNASFTPFLYTEVWIRATNSHFLIENLHILLDNPSLKYTATLDVAIPSYPRRDTDYAEGVLSELYNNGVQALLEKMPGLTCFFWEDVTLFTTTISTLHQECPKLRSLIIHNGEDIEQNLGLMDEDFNDGFRERRSLFATQDLSLFSNLINLEVYRIYGDLDRVRKDLAKLLLRSPNLKTLGLSISTETLERYDFKLRQSAKYLYFSDFLCREYVALRGRPLHLQKLVFGLSFILWHDPGNYFANLVNFESLEDVYISNKGHDVAITFMDDDDNIAWDLFTPSQCPNLITFGVDNVTESSRRWIDMLEPGYIHQFKTQRSCENDLNPVLSKMEGTYASSKSKMSMLVALTDDAELLNIQNIQALALWIDYPKSFDLLYLLQWLQASTSLEQLFLRIPRAEAANSQPSRDSFVYRVVTACKKLRFMGHNDMAWRIWREDGEDGGESKIRFEKLDRFESRAIGVFHPWDTDLIW